MHILLNSANVVVQQLITISCHYLAVSLNSSARQNQDIQFIEHPPEQNALIAPLQIPSLD